MELTAITLCMYKSTSDMKRFAEAIWKFHLRCQFRGSIRHIVVDASPRQLRTQFLSELRGLPEICGLEFHPGRGSWTRDYNYAFQLAETKFVVFFLPDHILEVQHDDFLSDCAKCLNENPDVYQIHLSGPYAEWSTSLQLSRDPGFSQYVGEHNPFRAPYYPWYRIDEDHLWYGGRLLYSKGLPSPGNPLERRVVDPGNSTLWVSPPQTEPSPIRSQAPFIAAGGRKHLGLGFNGAPSFYNMDIFRRYLPAPDDDSLAPADAGELYFYRQTDLDEKYGVGWLNAQTFFWHEDYGWELETEVERSLFREIFLHKEL